MDQLPARDVKSVPGVRDKECPYQGAEHARPVCHCVHCDERCPAVSRLFWEAVIAETSEGPHCSP